MKKTVSWHFVLVALLFIPLQSHAFSMYKTYSGGNSNFAYQDVLSASDSYTKVSNGKYNYTINADNKVFVTVFGYKTEVAQISCSTWNSNLYLYNKGTIEFLNNSIYTWYKSVPNTQTVAITPIIKEWGPPAANFWAGPIPLTAKAKVSASLAATAGSKITVSSLSYSIGPRAELAATVSAGVGLNPPIAGASAGVEGKLTILKSELLAKAVADFVRRSVTASCDWINTTLSGRIALYAEAYVSKLKVRWTTVLGEWSAYTKTLPIYSYTYTLL